jgi:glycosyltransferase involved in cell wall biosynthesis
MTQRTLLQVFPTFAVGGAQMRFVAIANHLGGAYRHIVVSLDGRTEARAGLDPGLDVRFAPVTPGVWGALRSIRQARPDLVITSNWGSMDWAAACRLLALPHIHAEDGFGPDEQDRQLFRRVWARRLLLRGSRVVLPSRTLHRIAAELWRLPPAQLHYVPNGIDIRRFAAAPPAALPPGQGPVIGTVAALRPEKNLARLLRAFALLHARMPARLVIVGDGPERAALTASAAALGIADTVCFAGASTAPERWLAAFHAFALTSDTEQMPLCVLEAMAAGLPVVSTDVGDVRDMLTPANAAFVVPRDAAALAGALAVLLGNATLARDIGAANAARAAAHYDQADMLRRWGRLLE